MDHYDNVTVVASTRGHLRIKIPQLYRSQQLKDRLELELGSHPGIIEVHANPLSARLLIVFEPGLQPTVLLLELGFLVVRPSGNSPPAALTRPAQPLKQPPPRLTAGPAMYAPWHARTVDEALAFHASSFRTGLSQADAEQRLRHGMNTIPPPRRSSALEILLNQFKTLPIVLLGIAAAVSALTGSVAEAAAIGAVLVLNGAIGFVTERQAEATIASLSELVDDTVSVLRDGEVRQIEASRLVPGDILVLSPGTRIGADVRLLQASALLVDESALTGESFPVGKSIAPLQASLPLADRRNMAYRGTAVSMGAGLGLVVGTGSRTEVGAIQALTSATARPKTPIQIQLDQLGNQLIKVSSAMCVAIFALGLLRGYQRMHMFKTAMALAIAAVPEGLPAVATTSLARGLGRMREQNVLIRHLQAVETIGAIQTICLDKTGTLTMNQMSAVAVQSARHVLHPGRAAGQEGGDSAAELNRLLQIGVLCNQADAREALADSPLQGSATETALLNLAAQAGVHAAALRERFPLLSTELRAEGRNYMRTVHALPGSQQRLVAVKGSPEEVLAMCACYLSGKQVCELDEETRRAVMQQNAQMSGQQLRVLGFAYAEGPEPGNPEFEPAALTWVGLVGLADPLRPGVERVIARFHQAGIRTIMLTGDQAGTAYVIGKALHLNNGDQLNIVNAEELDAIDPERLRELAANAHIFSRVTPSDKLRIVQAIRSAGTTVAMTGDGINDSPALRAADIGIAMGSGTAVALSVADIALKHDRLDAVLNAISQGRTISTNIRKSLHFLLSSNLSEILVVFGAVALGNGQPLTPLQLLWLNLLTDMLPAIALAAEPAEPEVMRSPPRDPQQNLVGTKEMWRYAREGAVLAAATLSAYVYGTLRYGAGPRAGTIAFDTIVLGQMLHALSCRSDRHRSFDPGAPPNRWLTLAIAATLGLQALAHVLPGLRRLLGIAPLGPPDLVAILAGAGLPLLVNEIGKSANQSSDAIRATAERSTSFSTSEPTTLSATLSTIFDAPGARG
jgi:Ca2+-transporting ATPase